jgi:ATP-dependent Clp protease ATP-binding subunit ClpA
MPIDLLVQIMKQPPEDSHAVTCLLLTGLTSLKLTRFLSHGNDDGETSVDPSMGGPFEGMMPLKDITSRVDAEKFLAKYCANLNTQAVNGKIDPLIGREEELDTIVQITARRSKNNSILVGEPGVGKTAIVEGLAAKIVANDVPDCLLGSTVFSLDMGALVSGTRFRGDMEERLKHILKSLEFVPNSILFIDEIHSIMGTGAGQNGTLDIPNLLKPSLNNGTLKAIGSTTVEEFRKHFEKDRALMRRFKRVDIKEPTLEDTKKILRGLKEKYEEFHGVVYSDEALDAAAELTHRYINNALLPDKAIDIIDNVGARQKIRPEADRLTSIGVAEIEAEVSRVAKIPEKSVKDDETTKLLHLEDDLKKTVFGQDEAIEALSNAVFVSRSGLRDTNKPAGCYLFAGPTGVGKTEAARQLADTLGIPLIKYDMSEYMEKHSVAKLIGSPPGYVGYGDGAAGSGKLINDVEITPHAVLLLDEIEKAHEDVYNLLLQVMDDAKLTSSAGKAVDFRNIILILTTNAGAAEAGRRSIGFGAANSGDSNAAIAKKFSPEFRNRLDATVQFNKLKGDSIKKVVEKFLEALKAQALARQVSITVTPEAIEWLVRNGFDETMGARPLARAIHDNIKTPLSRLMVVGDLRKGGTAIVSVNDNKIVVEGVGL